MFIYVDDNGQCHATPDNNMREIETTLFDGKCETYIEYFFCEFTPYGWKIYTHTPSEQVEAAQTGYEESLVSADKAYEEGVNSI